MNQLIYDAPARTGDTTYPRKSEAHYMRVRLRLRAAVGDPEPPRACYEALALA